MTNQDCTPPYDTTDKGNICNQEDMDKDPLTPACKTAKQNCTSPYDTTDACKTAKQNCTPPYDKTDECKGKGYILFYSGGLWFAIVLSIILIILLIIGYYVTNSITDRENNVKSAFLNFCNNVAEKIKANFYYIDLFTVFVLYIIFIDALILIITSAYDIKNSYELGAHLEKQCNNIFMEKERADFHVYSCYTQQNDYSSPAGIFANNNGAVKDRLKKVYNNITNIITFILVLTILIVVVVFVITITRSQNDYIKRIIYIDNKGDKFFWFYIIVLFLIFISLVTLLVLWINGNYKTSSMGTLLNPYNDTIFTIDESAYWGNNKNVKAIVLNNVLYIILILITVVVGLYWVNDYYIKDEFKISNTFIGGICVLLVMFSIVTPLVIETAQAFELYISGTYETSKQALTKLIKDYKAQNGKTWELIKKELEDNINTYARSKSTSDVFDKISLSDKVTTEGDYKDDDLYMYLTHIVNKNNIIGIPIPQQLKSMIKPEYLAGERSIELKEDLIKAHFSYSGDKESLTKESLTNAYSYLKDYLKEEVRIKISSDEGGKELELLNNYILFSDNFKKGNPFPQDIIEQLAKMRKDNTIMKTVNKYYSNINIVVYLLIILIAYYIYHNLIYSNDIDIKIQYVAMFIFVTMLIMSIAGWWMKEMWL